MPVIPTLDASRALPSVSGGVAAAPAAFAAPGKALARFGDVASAAGNRLDLQRKREIERIQRLDDGVFLTENTNRAARALAEDAARARREADASEPTFIVNRMASIDNILKGFGKPPVAADGSSAVSAEARATLNARFEDFRTGAFNSALRQQGRALEDRAKAALGEDLNFFASAVRKAPSEVASAIKGFGESVSSFNGSLGAEAERGAVSIGRTTLATAAVRGFLDGEAFSAARELLAAPAFESDIAPATREALGNEIAAAEARAARRDKAATIALDRQVAGDVKDAVFVLDQGRTPPNLSQTVATAKEFPALAASLDSAIADAKTMAGFSIKRPFEQAAAIDALRARETISAHDTRLLGRMERAQAASLKAIRDDPLGHGLDIGLYTEIVPIDFNDPASLAARAGQAAIAGAHFGISVPPLRDQEIAGLAGAVDSAPAAEVASLFSGLVQGFGRAGAAAIADRVASSRPALSVALSRASESPRVAADIIAGDKLLKANPEVKPPPVERMTAVGAIYGALFREVPSALAPHIAAANAIYAGARVPGGDLSFDSTAYENALRLAAGGAITATGEIIGGPIDFNGQEILPPVAGMEKSDLEALIGDLSPEDLRSFGSGPPVFEDGRAFTAAMFDKGFFGGPDAQLLTVAPGVYRVLMPGLGFVIDDKGDAYTLDLGRLARARGQ